MNTKHTPGPWNAIAKSDPDPSEGTHWIQCAIGALGYWRGHKQGHDDSLWILNAADAKLIAAAPDLLAALRELRYACTDKAEAMADAAIEKAVGEA